MWLVLCFLDVENEWWGLEFTGQLLRAGTRYLEQSNPTVKRKKGKSFPIVFCSEEVASEMCGEVEWQFGSFKNNPSCNVFNTMETWEL